ncbi:MAG TPA: hypothetical protein VFC30_06590 [Solirubrobacteraceae bacterium]|nr:hypothetical protein [Solirubrobacteraceae bacterium]
MGDVPVLKVKLDDPINVSLEGDVCNGSIIVSVDGLQDSGQFSLVAATAEINIASAIDRASGVEPS